jgi:hypothetical protein
VGKPGFHRQVPSRCLWWALLEPDARNGNSTTPRGVRSIPGTVSLCGKAPGGVRNPVDKGDTRARRCRQQADADLGAARARGSCIPLRCVRVMWIHD